METNKPSRAPLFLFGLVLGILGAIFLPTYVRPYIPQWVMGKTIVVRGTVAAKQKKENAVLLTVDTPEGVLLATFNKKVDEINLLINEKDAIEFTLPKYMPFIDDPKIIRVVRDQPATSEAPAEKPKEQGTKEAKPGRQEKLPAAASAPSATVVKPPAAAPAPGATEHKPLDRK